MSASSAGGTVRPAAKAGSWYTGDPLRLGKELDGYLGEAAQDGTEREAVGLMAPHAGYRYSGGVAGMVYAATAIPRNVVVLAVNHRGVGARAALSPDAAWEIPGAQVPVHTELADAIRARVSWLEVDAEPHREEHSLELQLPFLYRRQPALRVVPISLSWLDWSQCRTLGEAVAAGVDEVCGGDALVVASSDLSHYLPQARANELDHRALEKVLALDGEGLLKRCRSEEITMCGVVPTAATIAAARARGATTAELVDYRTSGDVSGDMSAVVGYAGVLFLR